jgi:hypothetical protein
MNWEQVRDRLQNHRFEIERTGPGKQDWVLRSNPDDPINPPQAFGTLGAGTNKMAVLVNGTSWVLLFGKTGRRVELDSFREEVDTLRALATRGLRVPRPIDGGQATYHFTITVFNDGDEPVVPAFLQAFMSREDFVEMTKATEQDRDAFARNHIVTAGRVPSTIDTTLADLRKIRQEMAQTPWGDFQVMYQKSTGFLYVFDPLRVDPNQRKYLTSIDTWLRDIEAARVNAESSARLHKAAADAKKKNVVEGRHQRRYSMG